MIVQIQKTFLKGEVFAAASKSAMQRACAAALCRNGETIIYNAGVSNDDLAAISIIQQLGAKCYQSNQQLHIKSSGVNPITQQINCGESGLSFRMFTSIAAMSHQPIEIIGSGSLIKRPQHFFNEVLPKLNVAVSSNQGFLPIQVQGPLTPQSILIDGSLSSQFLTGLLMAFSACNASNVTIHVHQLKSKPYIDLTLEIMEKFGMKLPKTKNYEEFYFDDAVVTSSSKLIEYTVEGDWSGAAFLLVAGAIAGDVVVKGLDVFSTQADKAILQALSDAGAALSIEPHQIHIQKNKLKAFHFNATDCPDLFPPLAVLAACCKGKSVIEGVSRLVHKESNRALTLQTEFQKLGVHIQLQDDLMIIEGTDHIKSVKTFAHHDHRIAMALATMALVSEEKIEIENAESINKSYPQFYHHLQQLGVIVNELE